MFEKIRDFWSKWSIIVCILLVMIVVYQFKNRNIEVKTVTQTVVDQTTQQQLNEQINVNKQLQKKLEKITNISITTDEEVVETTYPDGRKERIVRKKTQNNTSVAVNSNTTTNVSSSTTVVASSSSSTHTDTKTTTTTSVRNWIAGVGIMSDKQIGLEVGYNITSNVSVTALGLFTVNSVSINPGLFALIRF